MENGGWVVSLLAQPNQYTRARKSHKSQSLLKKGRQEGSPNGHDEEDGQQGGVSQGGQCELINRTERAPSALLLNPYSRVIL